MSTPRLLDSSGVAQNADLMTLRQMVLGNRLVAAPGQVGMTSPSGSAMSPARGFRAPGFTGKRGGVPWYLVGFIDTGPTAKISVRPGKVNNFVPTIDGISIVAVPRPALTVTGASGIIQLRATVDAAGAITDLIIESVAGPAVTTDTTTEKYNLVGTWTSGGGVFTSVNSILNTNQTFRVCGGNAEWY